MRIPDSREAIFVNRVNRFAAVCTVEGEPALVHVPHSGRLEELLVMGAPCRVVPASEDRDRKTDWDLLMVRHGRQWVCVDTRWANALVGEALARSGLPAFSAWPEVEAEVRVDDRRFDFRVTNGRDDCYIEVKCVTLVENGMALFPDAPTARGTAHLEVLQGLVIGGHAAALLFLVMRNDAEELVPYAEHDPAFAAALREARDAGVLIQAWTVDVKPRRMRLARTIPVVFA